MEGDATAHAHVLTRRKHRRFAWLKSRLFFLRRKNRPFLLFAAIAMILITAGSFAEHSVRHPAQNERRTTGLEDPITQPQPNPSTSNELKTRGLLSASDLVEWCDTLKPLVALRHDLAGSEFVDTPGTALARYPVTLNPLCLYKGGVYLQDEAKQPTTARSLLRASLGKIRVPVHPLDDFFLSHPTLVTAVPAMALLTQGNFAADHVVHLIHEVLEALWSLLQGYHDGALLRVPRQTVLFRSRGTDWNARKKDNATKGTALSARVLNGFSSTYVEQTSRSGKFSSFFSSSLIFEHGEEIAYPAVSTAYCFCQAMYISPKPSTLVSPEVFHGIRNGVGRQFSEMRPYSLTFRHASEEEKDRLARYSFMNSSAAYLPPETNATSATYRPRVLFIHRKSRSIANVDMYVQMFRDAGFRVEEVYPERLTVAEQFSLGRYADYVVGMHGLGLIHALWMDPNPPGCRGVLEFLPYVNVAFPVQYPRLFHEYLNMSFHRVLPKDATFGPEIKDAEEEKMRLMSNRNIVAVFRFPSLANQTCIYDESEVRAVITKIRRHLAICLYPS